MFAGSGGHRGQTNLEPDIVKLDMSLTRGIDGSPVKQKPLREAGAAFSRARVVNSCRLRRSEEVHLDLGRPRPTRRILGFSNRLRAGVPIALATLTSVRIVRFCIPCSTLSGAGGHGH